MKLSEIIKVPQQPTHGLDLTKFDNAKQFKKAKVETFPLLYNQDGDDYFFTIEINGEKAAFMKAEKITDMAGDVLMVKRTYVMPKFRNKGLMTALYRTLHNQRFSIISDRELSPESISIWKKLKQHYKIGVLDRDTAEIRSVEDGDFDPKGEELEKDHFILEKMSRSDNGWGPSLDNFVVEELNIFIKHDLL
jgi:hypothetical protein